LPAQWRNIHGWPGYQINQDGQVRSLARVITRSNGIRYRIKGRTLKPMMTKGGTTGHTYYIVTLSDHGHQERHYVHKLVQDAFGTH
jgi:hypothetical protein